MLRPFMRRYEPSARLDLLQTGLKTFQGTEHLLELDLEGVNTIGGEEHLPETPHDVDADQAGLAVHPGDERAASYVRELRSVAMAAVQNPRWRRTGPHQLTHLLCLGKQAGKQEDDLPEPACHL